MTKGAPTVIYFGDMATDWAVFLKFQTFLSILPDKTLKIVF